MLPHSSSAPPNLPKPSLRPITPADTPFLSRVFASTRSEDMRAAGYSPITARAFLEQQFQLQHNHYQNHYPNAEFLVIELDGKRIGRLYLRWEPDTLRIIDIALLPEYRSQGLGSALLDDLLTQADQRSLPVRLHVLHGNPAERWYRSRHFEPAGEAWPYLAMRRNAQGGQLPHPEAACTSPG